MLFGIKRKRGVKEERTVELRLEWLKDELALVGQQEKELKKVVRAAADPYGAEIERDFLKLSNRVLALEGEFASLEPLVRKEAPKRLKVFLGLKRRGEKVLKEKSLKSFAAYCGAVKR